MIVIPGFVNAHIHSWQTGLRGLAGNWISRDYHLNVHGNLATHFGPEDSYLGTLVGALGQINAGTTTIMDWCHNNATREHTDRSIDALEESGIRAVFGHGTVKPPQAPGQPHFSEIPHPRTEIERLRNGRLSSDDGLLNLAMAILGPDFSTGDVTLEDFRLAREFGLLSSSHVWNKPSRISKEGFFPVAEAGLLGPDHNVVHGNFLTDEELDVIIECGASVTVTPTVEMQTSEGDPLTGRVKSRGAMPSLGADTEVFVAGDMFHVTRFTMQAQRGVGPSCRRRAQRAARAVDRQPARRADLGDGGRGAGLDARGPDRFDFGRKTGRPDPHPRRRRQYCAHYRSGAGGRALCGHVERRQPC